MTTEQTREPEDNPLTVVGMHVDINAPRILSGRCPWKEAWIAFVGLAMIALGRWLVLGIFGCYSPDLSHVTYTCSTARPDCPDGLTCVGGICRYPGADVVPPAMDAAATPPDMGTDCSMCLSGRCKMLSAVVVGCYLKPDAPLVSNCLGHYGMPQTMPFPTDKDCLYADGDPNQGVWLGFARAWGTSTNGAAPPLKPWWNGQPYTGATYRFIAACGGKADTGWTTMNGYERGMHCMSGQAGDVPTSLKCPRGITPSDADFGQATGSDPAMGVMCVPK